MKKNTIILVCGLVAIAFMTYMLLSISTKKEEQVLLNTAPVIKAEGIEAIPPPIRHLEKNQGK